MTQFEPAEEPIGMPVREWKPVDRSVSVPTKRTRGGAKQKRTVKRKMQMIVSALALASIASFYGVYRVGQFYDQYTTHLQSPVLFQSPVRIEKRSENSVPASKSTGQIGTGAFVVNVAKADTEPEPATVPAGCEQYAGVVQKYFGELTAQALLVANAESGCNQTTKPSATQDYCIFQIHKEPKAGQDIDYCVRRAYEKYSAGRVGVNNWSAWYAVCTPDLKSKVAGIKCR